MTEINRRLDNMQETLASKVDIKQFKSETKGEIDTFMRTVTDKNNLEECLLGLEKMEEEVATMKKTNVDLFQQLTRQRQQITTLRRDNNDAEQHGRKWNLRVFNVPEAKPGETETGAVWIQKVCQVFTKMVGVPVTERDVEVAHRVGTRLPQQTRSRPIIVRFVSRKSKDDVLFQRRKLKGNKDKIAISEDLTSPNYIQTSPKC